jgi:hypothetical protein
MGNDGDDVCHLTLINSSCIVSRWMEGEIEQKLGSWLLEGIFGASGTSYITVH